jgi:Glycolipid transfer protein (GLTP)
MSHISMCLMSRFYTYTVIALPLLSIYLVFVSMYSSSTLNAIEVENKPFPSFIGSGPPKSTSTTSMSLVSLFLLYALGAQLLLARNQIQKPIRWIEKGVENATSIITQVMSADELGSFKSCVSFSAIRSTMSSKSFSQLLSLSGGSQAHAKGRPTKTISTNDMFISEHDLGNLSLFNIKEILTYIIEMNRPDFNRQSRLNNLKQNAQNVIISVEAAVSESMGSGTVLPRKTMDQHILDSNTMQCGNAASIDALGFVAFVRLFAEWRAVRLVPKTGYKAYAFGMGLAKRDLLQNAEKLENAVQQYLINQEEKKCSHMKTSSPTLMQILQFELDQRKHPTLPRLTDNSAASGLLWIQRQIQYQTKIFKNVAMIEYGDFKSSKDAALAAYRSTYELYHGFVLRQLFQRTVEASPDADVLLRYMNMPNLYFDDENDLTFSSSAPTIDEDIDINVPTIYEGVDIHEAWVHVPIDQSIVSSSPDLIIEADSPTDSVDTRKSSIFAKINGQIVRMFTQCSGKETAKVNDKNVFDMMSTNKSSNESMTRFESNTVHLGITPYRTEKTKQRQASEDISDYLETAQPILDELDILLNEFNMKDPSRC